MKASIRDLNAEFQMKGGKVTPSKKGDTYQLSHPDEKYLEEFRVRLLKELGLIEEKDIPKELQGPKAPPPRYGDKHQLRRGWNVRSDREFKQGIYNKEDIRPPEGDHYREEERRQPFDDQRSGGRGRDDRRERPQFDRRGHGDRPHHDRRGYGDRPPQHRDDGRGRSQFDRRGPGDRQPYRERPGPRDRPPQPRSEDIDKEDEEGTKSFEERWGNIDEYMSLIEEALKDGAVDDGQIIKFAYSREMDEEKIKKLKKLLWDNRCRGQREKCPHGKKKLRFEDMMKVCSGKVEGWQNIDSPFTKFLDLWKGNMEEMYGSFRDRDVEVEGKISSYKPVYRKGHEHLKILVYDTMVKLEGSDKEPRETRKLWLKLTLKEYHDLMKEDKLNIDDVIRLKGKCIYDKYFYDYWVVEIRSIEITAKGDGEAISAQQP
ncbi:MAG: hypothetical protein ACMUHB_05335 [Thermoplasmatota archaeon]